MENKLDEPPTSSDETSTPTHLGARSSPSSVNAPGTVQTKGKKFMFLRLGENHFAIHLSSVREVLRLTQVSPLPNMPAYFAGLINLRGKILSAIHLRKSLESIINNGTAPNPVKRSCIIIADVESKIFGAVVDDVTEVISINSSLIDYSVDNLSHGEYFSGIIKFENRSLVPILKLEKALRINELILPESLIK